MLVLNSDTKVDIVISLFFFRGVTVTLFASPGKEFEPHTS